MKHIENLMRLPILKAWWQHAAPPLRNLKRTIRMRIMFRLVPWPIIVEQLGKKKP